MVLLDSTSPSSTDAAAATDAIREVVASVRNSTPLD